MNPITIPIVHSQSIPIPIMFFFIKNLGYDNGYGFWIYGGGGHIDYYNNVSYNGDFLKLYSPALLIIGSSYDITALNNNWQIPDGLTYLGEHTAVFANGTSFSPEDISHFGESNISTDPGFVNGDISPPDVNLKEGSPMLDAGVPVYINNIEESYTGIAPDMGINDM